MEFQTPQRLSDVMDGIRQTRIAQTRGIVAVRLAAILLRRISVFYARIGAMIGAVNIVEVRILWQ
ncbi:hypothetical protein NM75_19275 [Dickeya fangzhongdai]|nr:hypothetical protein LH89_02040 [Dickeya fangzhongdai]KGT96608.1 hypothetical protein NM75_19275 [Dickeya fangzhongdai]